ncbi:hypothetical protein L1887_24260 [Cichorium endivia]|nr:hypothetical protein L1887_24260 [Cichorium endivia]
MNEFMIATQQQTQANSKAIANMERQIAQLAEDQRKRNSDKLASNTEVNPNHTQWAGKEHVNAVDSCTPEKVWRKVTMEDLMGTENKDEGIQKEGQSTVAGLKKKKKTARLKRKESAPSEPSINQPLWDELKDAREESRTLKEICKEKEKIKVPTPEKVRLTVEASKALLDLGASVNILPGYLYDKYKNEELEPAKTVLQLADQSTKKAKGHPLASVDKLQLLEMIEMMEKRQQAYTKDARNKESKVFQFLDAQQQWINQKWGSLSQRKDEKQYGLAEDVKLSACKCGVRTEGSGNIEGPDAVREDTRRACYCNPMRMGFLIERATHANPRRAADFDRTKTLNQVRAIPLAPPLTPCRGKQSIVATRQIHQPRRAVRIDAWPITARLGTNFAKTFLFVIFIQMAQQQVDYMPENSFLEFPGVLEETQQYQAQLRAISTRPVQPAIHFDRPVLTATGLWDQLLRFLHRTWTHAEGAYTFTCQGWDTLMAREDDMAYKELMLKFFSTCIYAPASREPRAHLIRFRLGGQSRERSLRDFSRRTEIYTEAEVGNIHFQPFLITCITDQPQRVADEVVWAEMSNEQFDAGEAKESQFRSPLYRLMHRLISTSVTHRRGCEKVSRDMFYMWALLDPSRFLNLPFTLAVFLTSRAVGAGTKSPMTGGQFITRLARSYRILTADVIAHLAHTPPTYARGRYLETIKPPPQVEPEEESGDTGPATTTATPSTIVCRRTDCLAGHCREVGVAGGVADLDGAGITSAPHSGWTTPTTLPHPRP